MSVVHISLRGRNDTRKKQNDTFPLDQQGEEEMPARKCPYCKAISNFNLGHEVPAEGHRVLSLDQCQNCARFVYFKSHGKDRSDVSDIYPRTEEEPDEELAEDIKIPLREAYNSLDDRNWNSCVTMARRALQEAVDDLKAKGSNLYDPIEDLANNHRITPDLRDWANEGRLGGNLGAHGSKAKKWAC